MHMQVAATPDAVPTRGDVHVLVVGDPGLGKSQLLQVGGTGRRDRPDGNNALQAKQRHAEQGAHTSAQACCAGKAREYSGGGLQTNTLACRLGLPAGRRQRGAPGRLRVRQHLHLGGPHGAPGIVHASCVQ